MNWYLLQCKPNQVNRARENLGNQGFDTYCPEHKVKRLLRRQLSIKSEPVFPGYLFIQLDAHSNWQALRATRGVSRIVSFNGMPYPVSDTLISALQQHYGEHITPAPLYQAGDKVRITDGCFKDIEAIVKAVTSDERIIVLMNILHSEQALAMDARQLAKAG